MLINHWWGLLICNAAALLVYMTVIFAVAYRRKRLDTVDAAWGGAFVVAGTMVAGLQPSPRTILIAILIDIWALRLANHIIDRIKKHSEDDPRYVELAKKWGKDTYWQNAYVSVFLTQGLAALVISLPTVFAAGANNRFSTGLMIIGGIIWLKGFIIEAVGDRQLRKFISNKKNKGKVLDSGLWRYSRHPNYLGEITQWYGIGIIACAARYGYVGLTGPLLLNILIRYISGVPPIENRKQKDPAYAAYMQRTNAILPRLKRVTEAK